MDELSQSFACGYELKCFIVTSWVVHIYSLFFFAAKLHALLNSSATSQQPPPLTKPSPSHHWETNEESLSEESRLAYVWSVRSHLIFKICLGHNGNVSWKILVWMSHIQDSNLASLQIDVGGHFSGG
jgi:hypothetical protein